MENGQNDKMGQNVEKSAPIENGEKNLRSEKLQNENAPNFSNSCPEFCPEFCSEFSPKFLRIFRASFRGKRRPEKIHQKSPPFFNAKFPGKFEEKIHKSFLESGQSKKFSTKNKRVYPYPLGAGSARPNPKMGAPESQKSGRKKAHKHKLFALDNFQRALGQTAGCPGVNRAKKFTCANLWAFCSQKLLREKAVASKSGHKSKDNLLNYANLTLNYGNLTLNYANFTLNHANLGSERLKQPHTLVHAKKFMCSPRNTGNINFSLWLTGRLSQGCPDFQKVYVFKVCLFLP